MGYVFRMCREPDPVLCLRILYMHTHVDYTPRNRIGWGIPLLSRFERTRALRHVITRGRRGLRGGKIMEIGRAHFVDNGPSPFCQQVRNRRCMARNYCIFLTGQYSYGTNSNINFG